jgi:hypothetical protein
MQVAIFNEGASKGVFVTVSKREALSLIHSLVEQLQSGTPNAGRLESRCTGDAGYFTVAVMEQNRAKP